MRTFTVFSSAFLLIALGIAAWFYLDYQKFLQTPLNVAEGGLEIRLQRGDSVASLGQRLQAQGVLDSPWYLQVYARLSDQARSIKAGDYRIETGITPPELLARLVSGKVVQHSLTIPEGWTFRQMLTAVWRHPHLENTLAGLSQAEIMARLGYPKQHPEGRFFPDTYHFPAGTTDLAFLQRAYNTMQAQLIEAWEQRSPDSPLQTPYEALILASIIEKETSLPEERAAIAGVFVRRLNKGMLLQTDPTVIYGLGENFDGNLRRSDLDADTPYNTYTRTGLPPTPIALPGLGSLQAALNPAPGEALYFVAKGDGGHTFSRTLNEHNRAVRQYLRNRTQ